jgi:ATP-dependent Clp protease ATP-binding subunit ClpA
MKIIDIELHKLSGNMRTNESSYQNIEISFDEKAKRYVYDKGINEDYGARPLKRFIEKEISTPLARKLLSGDADGDSIVSISVDENGIVFGVSKKLTNPPLYITDEYKEMNGEEKEIDDLR